MVKLLRFECQACHYHLLRTVNEMEQPYPRCHGDMLLASTNMVTREAAKRAEQLRIAADKFIDEMAKGTQPWMKQLAQAALKMNETLKHFDLTMKAKEKKR